MSKRQQQQRHLSPPYLADPEIDDSLMELDPNPTLFEHLIEDFQEMMGDQRVLRTCVEKFIDNAIDQFTLGILFDVHRKFKTNAYCLEVHENGDDDEAQNDAFRENSMKKIICPNPNCKRAVCADIGFSTHLATCMGVPLNNRPSRNASRRAVRNKNRGDLSAYANAFSDDDDEDDRLTGKAAKKKDKNGGKKGRGTPKKSLEPEPLDPVNVDIEVVKGSYDEVTNLRYMMDQSRRSFVVNMQERRSSSTSPTENSEPLTAKNRDKAKKRTRGRQRGSPSTSVPFD